MISTIRGHNHAVPNTLRLLYNETPNTHTYLSKASDTSVHCRPYGLALAKEDMEAKSLLMPRAEVKSAGLGSKILLL